MEGRSSRRETRGVTFGEIIAVLVLTALIIGGGLYWIIESNGEVANTMPGATPQACVRNLKELRNIIKEQRFKNALKMAPASLATLPGVGASMLSCPVGHEPYAYDPATGIVKCPHAGHEKF